MYPTFPAEVNKFYITQFHASYPWDMIFWNP